MWVALRLCTIIPKHGKWHMNDAEQLQLEHYSYLVAIPLPIPRSSEEGWCLLCSGDMSCFHWLDTVAWSSAPHKGTSLYSECNHRPHQSLQRSRTHLVAPLTYHHPVVHGNAPFWRERERERESEDEYHNQDQTSSGCKNPMFVCLLVLFIDCVIQLKLNDYWDKQVGIPFSFHAFPLTMVGHVTVINTPSPMMLTTILLVLWASSTLCKVGLAHETTILLGCCLSLHHCNERGRRLCSYINTAATITIDWSTHLNPSSLCTVSSCSCQSLLRARVACPLPTHLSHVWGKGEGVVLRLARNESRSSPEQ